MDWRAGRAGRLSAPSTFERELRSQPDAPRMVVLPAPEAAEYAAMTLPRLSAPEADPALLSAVSDVVLVAAEETPTTPSAPTPPGSPRTYQIAKGDTIAKIARREFGSNDPRTIATLLAANPALRGRETRLTVGQEIALPAPAALQQALGARVLAGTGLAGSAATPATAEPHWYTIRPNDSLASIAQRYLKDKRRWPEIAAANTALDPRKMLPGTRIKLPLLQLAQQ
jgi:nucleoid-associated protein YgaU